MVNLRSIPPADPFVLVVSREEIERGDIQQVLRSLNTLLQSTYRASGYRNRVSIAIHGYDNDRRELFEIKEVRAFVEKLDREFPYWFYFLSKSDDTLKLITFCLCRVTKVTPGATAINPDDFLHFLQYHFGALNHLFEQLGLPEEDNIVASEEVESYYRCAQILN